MDTPQAKSLFLKIGRNSKGKFIFQPLIFREDTKLEVRGVDSIVVTYLLRNCPPKYVLQKFIILIFKLYMNMLDPVSNKQTKQQHSI